MRRRAATALLAACALLTAAAPASAGTASVVDGTLVYTDTPGQARQVNWARDASSFAIQEVVRNSDTVTPSAGPGCTVASSSSVGATYVCSADGVSAVRIDLGDGDDFAEPATVSSSGRTFDDIIPMIRGIEGLSADELDAVLWRNTFHVYPRLAKQLGQHLSLPTAPERTPPDS